MGIYISEIMSSIQGEGTKIGYRQIFVRLAGCNLKCEYCDTLNSLANPKQCRVEEVPGTNNFLLLDNPMKPSKVAQLISKFDLNIHHSISFTGGEPLLNTDFIEALYRLIREQAPHLKIFLETNGTLTDKLKEIIQFTDIISMDFKIPSTSHLKPLWDEHREFLALASTKEVYVKVVFSDHTPDSEIERAAVIIKDINENIPLILQPCTVKNNLKEIRVNAQNLFNIQALALKYLKDVRVIPQTHLFLGLL